MQDQPTPAGNARSGFDMLERAALGLLLDQHPALYSLAELARELDITEVVAEETVAALARRGLVNRWEVFVVASRAAVRLDELGC
jgi:predicted DNA-binding transcriptional regulator